MHPGFHRLMLVPELTNTYTIGLTPVYDRWLSTDGLNNGNIGSTETIENVVLPGANTVLNSIPLPPYYGHNIFIVQDSTGDSNAVCRKSITVIWEFKEPVLNPRID
jgi:hypothetical protein